MIAIIGAGIVGLSTAWELVKLGQTVTVLDAATPGSGASGAATAYLEPRLGDTPVKLLERRALALWEDYAAELETSGVDVGLRREGQIRVCRSGEEAAFAEDLKRREALGWQVRALDVSEARQLEPMLGADITAAAMLPEVRTVDGPACCRALVTLLTKARVDIRSNWPVSRMELDGTLVSATGEGLAAKKIVYAHGLAANDIVPKLDDLPPVRPVRGVNLVLDATAHPDAPRHLIKHKRGTFCPRGDVLLVGTTYEAGETSLEPGPDIVERLWANAETVMPSIRDLPLLEVTTGLRAKVGDGTVSFGRSRHMPAIHWTLGHAGAGYLRAPLFAPAFARFIADGTVPSDIAAFTKA